MIMNVDVLFFFNQHMGVLPFYEALETRVTEEIEKVRIKVQKSQISFYNRHMFACVSFARIRKKKDCPENYMVVTFGLNYKVESSRVENASEPYPGRWTHHVLISDIREIDDELMGWMKEAAAFSDAK